jgi:hypothetical protein
MPESRLKKALNKLKNAFSLAGEGWDEGNLKAFFLILILLSGRRGGLIQSFLKLNVAIPRFSRLITTPISLAVSLTGDNNGHRQLFIFCQIGCLCLLRGLDFDRLFPA